MRYCIAGRKMICHMTAFLFCLVILSSELNIFGKDSHSGQSDTDYPDTFSDTSSHNKKMDFLVEILAILSDEVKADISSGMLNNKLSFRSYSFKYMFLKTIKQGILLTSWVSLIILLQKKYVNRMYLIRFIHNSDGEKGKL